MAVELLKQFGIDPENEVQDWSKVTMNWNDLGELRSAAKKIQQEKIMKEKFGITDYVWSDMDTQFSYKPEDVPIMDLKGQIRLRISRYRALDRWIGVVRSRVAKLLRHKLGVELSNYCTSIPEDPGRKCLVGELCFAKLPSFEEIDKLMEQAIGREAWGKLRMPEMRVDRDDRRAGLWVRAVCDSVSKCGKFAEFTDIDTGRKFPASWINCRKAVYHYLTTPATAYRCTLLLTNPFQVTDAVHEKWMKLMKRGDHFRFNLLCITSEETLLLRLSSPTEDELDAKYKAMLGGVDPSTNRKSPLYNPPNEVYNRKGLFF
jgi:hypothetical protein